MTGEQQKPGLAGATGRASFSSFPSSRCFGCRSTTGSSLTLGGIPFFYWYQLAWILLGAGDRAAGLCDRDAHHACDATPEKPSGDTDGRPGDIL